MNEVWKPVLEAPNDYAVSNRGRVKRTSTRTRAKAGYVLKQFHTRDGYRSVGLSTPNKKFSRRVHRLVWEAFECPIPQGLVVNHKNGDKSDNRLANLEMVTVRENVLHAFRTLGRRRPGEKLDPEAVLEMREARAAGETLTTLAERFDVTPTCVGHVCTGKTWKHAGGPITRKKARRAAPRLPQETVEEIIRRHQAGESSGILAQEYGVSDVSVLNWSRGRFRRS